MGLLVALGLASCGVVKDREAPQPDGGTDVIGAGGQDGAASSVVAVCNDYCRIFSETCPDCAHLSPVMSSCIFQCVVEVQECHSINSTAECMSYRCIDRGGEASLDTVTASCQDAWKLYLDCIVTQKVICAPDGSYISQPGDCEAQANSIVATCG